VTKPAVVFAVKFQPREGRTRKAGVSEGKTDVFFYLTPLCFGKSLCAVSTQRNRTL
jgi:hypothetical protein